MLFRSVMEVGSVSSGINAALTSGLQAQAGVRQSEQTQQTQQAQQNQQSAQTEQTQNTRSVDEREAADRARSEVENARPTVNANGQTVGTRVNTTA